MKVAYSLLLGEHVDAKQVEHADTIGFQIVCPACKDVVFKVAREMPNGMSEFFSHHQSPKEIVADCELRVASITSEQRTSSDSVSRGQTLKAFTSVLRDALSKETYLYRQQMDVAATHKGMWDHSGVSYLLGLEEQAMVEGNLVDDIREYHADRYMRSLDGVGAGLDTVFSVGIQRRIAMDILGHLRAPHSARNRRFVLMHSYCLEYTTYSAMGVRTQAVPEAERGRIGKLADFHVWLKGAGARALLEKLHGDHELANYVLGSFRHAMFGALLRLPYQAMLANHRQGLPMLQGIVYDGVMPMGTRRTSTR